MLGLIHQMPAEAYIPWSFLFAATLLASGVDVFARRTFNPVVLCVWFFGVTFSGLVGAWGATEFTAAMLILVTPHMLICSFSARGRQPETDESDNERVHDALPISMVPHAGHDADENYRRVA